MAISVSQDDAANPLLTAALAYARRGWPVFPVHSLSPRTTTCDCGDAACTSAAKHPWTRHGLKDATTNPDTILRMWRRWPRANVGIVTGKASGLLVLDIDPRHGGDEALDEFIRRHGALPATCTSLTGGGGRHLLFSYPEHVRTSPRNKTHLDGLDGLDVRAEGGYIVAPPSLHVTGALYEWLNSIEDPSGANVPATVAVDVPADDSTFAIAPAPNWFFDLVCVTEALQAAGQRVPAEEATPIRMLPTRREGVIGEKWLQLAVASAREGNRNDRGFWLACQLRDDGVDTATAESRMREYAASVGRLGASPYSEREAVASLRAAYAAPARQPATSTTSTTSLTAQAPSALRASSAATSARPLTASSASAYMPESDAQPAPAPEMEPTRKPSRFKVLRDVEVESLPAPAWLVQDFVPDGSLSVVYGEFASAKSFLTLDWALSVATGTPWCGRTVKQGAVLYIAGEGLRGMSKRIKAWKQWHGWQGETDLYVIGDTPRLMDAGDVQALIETVQSDLPTPPTLIVIDTLARAMVGADENSAKDMGLAIASANLLQKAFDATVLLVHHKPAGLAKTRGSTALPGATEAMIDVTRDKSIITVCNPKQKDDEEQGALHLKLTVVELPDGLTSCVLTTGTSQGLDVPLSKSADVIVSILNTNGGRQQPLAWWKLRDAFKASGMSPRSLDNGLKWLEEHAIIRKTGAGYLLVQWDGQMDGSTEETVEERNDGDQ